MYVRVHFATILDNSAANAHEFEARRLQWSDAIAANKHV